MPESFTRVGPDSTGKKLHVRERVISSNTINTPYYIPLPVAKKSFVSVSSPKTLGSSSNQNIFALNNASGSGVLVLVNEMILENDVTTLASPMYVNVYVITSGQAAGGAGTLPKAPFDTLNIFASSGNVNALAPTLTDGGFNTAITATLPTTPARRIFISRTATYGQMISTDREIAPSQINGEPLILRENQSVVVEVADASNPTNNNSNFTWFVSCAWTEFTAP